MKRIFTMLALVLLCASTWAQKTTTLLDASGDTEANWQKDGVAIFSGATPTYENGGMQMTTKNGTASLLTTLAPTENSILNIEAEFNLYSNTGRYLRDGNASYFRFGNIYILENDQDQTSAYQIAETLAPASANPFTQTGATYRSGSITKNASYYVTMEINTATNTLTSMKVYLTKESTTPTLELTDIPLPTTDYTVGIGYKKVGGVKTNQVELLKSIKVTQTTQEVQTANYTVNWVCNNATVKTDTRRSEVGSAISLTTSDKEAFNNKDNTVRYLYVGDDAADKTVVSDGSSVVSITVREASKYDYTVKSNTGKVFASATGIFEDSKPTVYVPKYYMEDSKYYAKDDNDFGVVVSSDNKEITLNYSVSDIDYYVETADMHKSHNAAASLTGSNYSMGTTIRLYAGSYWYTDNLGGGIYTVTIPWRNQNKTSNTVNIYLRDADDNLTDTGKSFVGTNASSGTAEVTGVEIPRGYAFVLNNTDAVNNSNVYMDYVAMKKTAEAISLPYTYTTFSSASALDFTDNADVEAYMAQMNGDGTAVALRKVTQVPAGTGVVLKKISGAETTTVNVLADAAALAGNQMVGVTEDNKVSAQELITAGNAYVLVEEQFCKVVTGATGYIPAGKAYLSVPVRNAAKALRLDFNGTPTEAVSVAEKAEKTQDAIYNVQGIRVQKPTVPGLYIINGKTYRF